MLKKPYIIFLFLLCCTAAMAQNFKIVSVEYLERSMQAVDNKVTEQGSQGRDCALLRIATENLTQEQQDRFDFGTDMGSKVEKRAHRDGEIWLWVTPGMRYLILKGIGLGGSRELAFDNYGVTIQSMKTYKIVIRGMATLPPPPRTSTQQFLMFSVTPKNATLEVNGELWSLDAEGNAVKYVEFGNYTYRVRASDHFEEEGSVTVDDPDNTVTKTVTLRPNYANVTLKVDADAEIWVNNQRKGIRTWTGPLGSGICKIECRMANHDSSVTSQEITPKMNGQTINLPAPTPIYGSLNVESTPQLATIYIDGKEMGKTPKSVNEILVGAHEMRLTKEGYADYTETVTIAKGERKQVKPVMKKQEVAQPAANVSSSEGDLTFTVNGVSFTMKLVEGGTFRMGSNDSEANGDEKPVHSVTVSTFYMGETEVTQALWKAVMGSNPSNWKGDNLPVESVSWNDCQEFIRKLNQLTGRNFRLPTEAEWEYAARGGSRSGGTKYAGSSSIGSVAWYYDMPHAVKGKSPNELGLYDMSGNVYEWCSDWYGDYGSGSQTNPKGPSSGSARVHRGGSWYSTARCCRVSYRDGNDPDFRYYYFGFRLCLPQ